MPACSLRRTKLLVQHCCHNKHFCNICKRFTMPHCSSFVVCKKSSQIHKKGPSPTAGRFITETSDHKEDDDDFFNGGRLLEDAFGHPFFSICSNCFVCTKVLLNFASLFVLELCISFPLQKLSHVGFFQELVAMTTKTSSRTLSECRALLAWCEETTAKTSKWEKNVFY